MIDGYLEQYRQRAVAYAKGLGASCDDAEDVVQDASIRAWQGWPPEKDFWAWFQAIVRNTWNNKCNSASDGPWIPQYTDEEDGVQVQLLSLDALTEAGWDIADEHSDPAIIYEEQETEAELRGLVSTLPEKQGQCLKLAVDGYDYREIADIVGISYAAVRFNVRYARRNLRKNIREG